MTFTADATNCPSSQCSEATCYVPPKNAPPGCSTSEIGACDSAEQSCIAACGSGCSTQQMTACTTAEQQCLAACSGGGPPDAGVTKDAGGMAGDGGAGGPCSVAPRTYSVTYSCSSTTCPNSFPQGTQPVAVDSTGSGDYIAGGSFAGSCACDLDSGTCTTMWNCTYSSFTGGHAGGMITWSGSTGTGQNWVFSPSINASGSVSAANCNLTLQ